MLGEIDHGKSIEVGKLHEDALRRAVGIRVESHRAHAIVEFDFPSDLVGLQIDDCYRFGFDRAGNGVFSVGRDVNVVDASVDGYGFCERKGRCVNHVDGPRKRADAHQHAAPVLGYG